MNFYVLCQMKSAMTSTGHLAIGNYQAVRKFHSLRNRSQKPMVIVLCNDGEIEVPDGEVCVICGQDLEEFDEVTGTGIHGYYHWIWVNHVDA